MGLFDKLFKKESPPSEEMEATKAVQNTRDKLMIVHTEEVIDIAKRLAKAYDMLMQTRRALSQAEEELVDAQIRNLEKQLAGENEEDLAPFRKRVEDLRKKVEEVERLVHLLEGKAKRIDPEKFSFIP